MMKEMKMGGKKAPRKGEMEKIQDLEALMPAIRRRKQKQKTNSEV